MDFKVSVERPFVGDFIEKMEKMRNQGVTDCQRLEPFSKPNGAARAHNPNRKPAGRFAKSGEEAILELLYDGPLISQQVRDEFIKQGRSGASISSCLHKLKTEGDIGSGPEGYFLTKKARDRMRSQLTRDRKNKGKKK